MKIGYVTRVESFCSAHRLNSTTLNEQQNKDLYGKCNSKNGHGHNYKVKVTIKGEINETTGMIINLTDLKLFINQVISHLDHKNIDLDVAYFKNVPSTAENLSVYIWSELEKLIGSESTFKLYEVYLEETEKNIAIYRGE